MKIEELRYGNKIIYIDKEVSVDEHLFVDYSSSGGYCELYFKPIPITEEWLKRFGFKEGKKGPFAIDMIPDKLFISMDWEDPEEGIRVPKPKFVHQLQNLYFAITGEELK